MTAGSAKLSQSRRDVLDGLARAGGIVSSPSGLAVRELARQIGRPTSNEFQIRAFTALLKSMEKDELIMRELNGRRTYGILLAVEWAIPEIAAEAMQSGEPPPPFLEGRELVELEEASRGDLIPDGAPPELEVDEEPTEGWTSREVADELLKMVVWRATHPIPEPIDPQPELLDRLGRQTSETQRLMKALEGEKQVSERLADELTAVKSERTGLRNQLRQLQENFERLKEERNGAIDAEVERRISSFMRERPRPMT